jgi:uncharacterized membrane protein
MVFVVRIRIVVVTAGKGRRQSETLISVYVVSRDITHFLLTFVEPYKKKTKQPVFGCCSARVWCQRKLNRFMSRSLKWAEFVSCYFLIFGSLFLRVSRTRERANICDHVSWANKLRSGFLLGRSWIRFSTLKQVKGVSTVKLMKLKLQGTSLARAPNNALEIP